MRHNILDFRYTLEQFFVIFFVREVVNKVRQYGIGKDLLKDDLWLDIRILNLEFSQFIIDCLSHITSLSILNNSLRMNLL